MTTHRFLYFTKYRSIYGEQGNQVFYYYLTISLPAQRRLFRLCTLNKYQSPRFDHHHHHRWASLTLIFLHTTVSPFNTHDNTHDNTLYKSRHHNKTSTPQHNIHIHLTSIFVLILQLFHHVSGRPPSSLLSLEPPPPRLPPHTQTPPTCAQHATQPPGQYLLRTQLRGHERRGHAGSLAVYAGAAASLWVLYVGADRCGVGGW